MSRAPPGSRPPAYAMVSRVYSQSLRPVVVVTALITAGWTLVSGIGAFQEVNVDKDHGFPKFSTIAIALGALYMTVLAIELFGVTAAIMNKLLLIRIYSFLSVLSALIVIAAAFTRVVIHFVFKNDLIKECTQLATGQDVVIRFGIWGPTIRDQLRPDEAQDFCNHWWSRDSFGEIISLIILILLSFFFVSISFAFYHQLNDPTFQRTREAPPTARNDQFPDHYNPPYVGYAYNAPTPPQGAPPRYDPPAGPPPAFTQGTGYGVGGPKGGSSEDLKADNPFADFDEPVNGGKPGESKVNLV